MRRLTDWKACLASLFLLVEYSRCAPEVAFPVNSQVPPVAHTSQPYSFAFSDTTFRSTAGPISYRIDNAPQWLSIDSNTRTLQGTPEESDGGVATFALSATDSTGTTSEAVTLVIVSREGISQGDSILPSLRAAGQVQDPSTLFLNPLTAYSISFPSQIFSGTGASTTYYAVSDDNSPLPSWVQFDSQSLRLSGTTPTIISSSTQQQSYGIKLIATDVIGFAEASVTFTISVANRLLYFQSATEVVNVTRGERFESIAFRDTLYQDGGPIESAQLGTVEANLPSWLSLDRSSITLSGTPPDEFTTQLISISAQDRSNDVANLTVTLRTASNATGETLNITARQGEYLVSIVSSSIIGTGDQATADFGDAASWLSFSNTNMSFYGQVPQDLDTGVLDVSLAVTKDGVRTTYPVAVDVVSAAATSSSATNTQPAATATSTPEQNSNVKPRHVLAIVLTCVFCFLAVVAIILLCLWWRRRKEKKKRGKEMSDDEQAHSHYSGPESDNEEGVDDPNVDLPVVPEASRPPTREQMVQTPRIVPQVELPWAPDSIKRARSRLQKKRKPNPHESFDSNWGGLVAQRKSSSTSPARSEETIPGAVHSDIPPPIPTYSPMRKQSLVSNKIAKRTSSKRSNDARGSKALSNVTNRRSGLPNRLSNAGIGHGSGILAPSYNSGNPYRNSKPPTRSSWATTYASTLGGKENVRPSVATTNLEHFPIPPSTSQQDYNSGHRTSGSMAGCTDTKPSLAGLASAPTKPSLRLVSASPSNSNLYDPEQLMRERDQYYRDRAKANLEGQSTYFSNASTRSRTPSLSRFIPGTSAIRSPSTTFPIAEESDSPVNHYTPAPATNWSRWHPAPVPAPNTTTTTYRGSNVLSPQPQHPPTRFGPNVNSTGTAPAGSRLSHAISVSSGQFSSALSSDDASQWEDYDAPGDVLSPYQGGYTDADAATDELLFELGVTDSGERQWTTTSSSAGNSAAPSPRLPFDNGRPSGETDDREVGLAITQAMQRASQVGSGGRWGQGGGLRLVDNRKRVMSVDGKENERTGRGRDVVVGGEDGDGGARGLAWGGREKSQKGSLRFI